MLKLVAKKFLSWELLCPFYYGASPDQTLGLVFVWLTNKVSWYRSVPARPTLARKVCDEAEAKVMNSQNLLCL